MLVAAPIRPAAGALIIAILVGARWALATEPVAANPPVVDYLPASMLVDQTGHHASLAALKGKPVLVAFIHTSCGGICELLTAKMKSVASELEPRFATKVTMVSVTTDPREDRPAALAAYAKTQGATGDGWLYLTGGPEQVTRVLKLYKVPAGDPDDELTHFLDIFLIGPDGRELHQYHGTQVHAAEVAADIRNAVARR